MNRMLIRSVSSLCLLSSLVLSVAAQETPSAADAHFQRGFFLQVHEHDLAGAAAAYERVASDSGAPEALRKRAQARLAGVREDLASANFANLMPADVMGYAEIVEPGEHVARILKMMDLLGPADPARPAGEAVPLGGGLQVPHDFTISPALVAELKKLRGAAVGITAIDDRGRPAGLAVIHAGDCDLLRGAIETAVQLLPPGEPIEGFKTYRLPEEIGWVMMTARLVLASDSREGLAAAVGRLRQPQGPSLATRPEFQRSAAESKGALLFAFVDGQQIVKRYGSMLRGREAAMIRGLLDLDHFESLVVALHTTDRAIQLRADLNLTAGHHNMLYALVRTAPITKRSLERVPQGAAGVLVVGLNPAGPPPARDPNAPPNVSAMDIGREFFNNIEELAVFAAPPAAASSAGQAFPEVGVVIAVKDPVKSEALWNQILSLAALFGARAAQPPADVNIEGKPGREYRFDGVPPVVVVRADRELVIGTHAAVTASLRATAESGSIMKDAAFAPLLAGLTPDTSKALLVDVGRSVGIAAALAHQNDARNLQMIGELTHDSKFSIMTDEAPNRLTIRAEVTGLPKFAAILSLLGGRHENRRTTAIDR